MLIGYESALTAAQSGAESPFSSHPREFPRERRWFDRPWSEILHGQQRGSVAPPVSQWMKPKWITLSSSLTPTQTVEVGGFPSQPKGYILIVNGRRSDTDAVGLQDARKSYGFACATDQRGAVAAFYDQGGAAAAGGGAWTATGVYLETDAAGNVTGKFDHDAFTANGVRLVCDDQLTDSVDALLIAFGGDSITNVHVSSRLSGTATGNVDFTGFGFDPDNNSLHLFIPTELGFGSNFEQTDEDIIHTALGAATPQGDQYVTVNHTDDDVLTMETASYSLRGECMATIEQGVGNVNFRASFVQSIPGGIRLNVIETPGYNIGFVLMSIKGGNWKLSDFQTRTDGNDISVTGLPSPPSGAVFVSHGLAQSTPNTPDAGARFSIGACGSADDESCLALHDMNGTADMETATAQRRGDVYANIDTGAAISGAMRIRQFPVANGFTMFMSDPDASAAFVWFLAAGDQSVMDPVAGREWPDLSRFDRRRFFMQEGWQRTPRDGGVAEAPRVAIGEFPRDSRWFSPEHGLVFLGFQRGPLSTDFTEPQEPVHLREYPRDRFWWLPRRDQTLETWIQSPRTADNITAFSKQEFPRDIWMWAPRRREDIEKWLRSPLPGSVEPQSGQTIRVEPLQGCGSNPWRMLRLRSDAQFTWQSWQTEVPLVVETPPVRGEWPTDLRLWKLPDHRRELREFTASPQVSHWCEVGAVFLYTAANWSVGVQFYFEAYFRAFTLTGRARLFNVTDNAAVAGSEVITTSPVNVRMRSGPLTLADGREYITQIHAEANVSATAIESSRLVAI